MKYSIVVAAAIIAFATPLAAQQPKSGPGQSEFAPGQRANKPGDAKKFAPGQRAKKPGDAKMYAPGQQPTKKK